LSAGTRGADHHLGAERRAAGCRSWNFRPARWRCRARGDLPRGHPRAGRIVRSRTHARSGRRTRVPTALAKWDCGRRRGESVRHAGCCNRVRVRAVRGSASARSRNSARPAPGCCRRADALKGCEQPEPIRPSAHPGSGRSRRQSPGGHPQDLRRHQAGSPVGRLADRRWPGESWGARPRGSGNRPWRFVRSPECQPAAACHV